MKGRFLACFAVLSILLGCGKGVDIDAADAVYVNGKIYAGIVDDPWASAVAVAGDRIVYVGKDASAYIGPETNIYDLGNKLVIPGITDAHSHPGMVARTVGMLLLEEASSKQELLDNVAKLVAENPDKEVLIGGFWLNEFFGTEGPHKKDLDAIESERPLILYDDWAHTVWANSVALQQAGVDNETKNIVEGFSFYQKDAFGEPTGWVTESAASVFVNQFHEDQPGLKENLLAYLNDYRGNGVTTVLDAGNFGLDRQVLGIVSELEEEGLLPVRYHGVYTLFLPHELTTAVQSLKKLGEDFNSEKIRVDTLKVFFDGILETRTAAVSSDYLDTPGNSGEALFGREQMHQLILELEAEGLNLHVHAVGDRSITTVLDAVEDARETLARPTSIRIAICHLEVVKESDFPRFKDLGVIAQFTPHWTVGGDFSWVEKGIGDKYLNMQRSNTVVQSGATVTFSSDITSVFEWESDRANPYLGMQVGHNRQDIDGGPEADRMPPIDERLDRIDLVDGYTSNGAYQLGREDELGTIAVGMRADLVILNQDLFEVDRYDIHNTKPVAVVMDGELVTGNLGLATK